MKSKLFLGLFVVVSLASSSNGFCDNKYSEIIKPYRDGTTFIMAKDGAVSLLSKDARENIHLIYDVAYIEVEGLDLLALGRDGELLRFKGHPYTQVSTHFWGWSTTTFIEKFSDQSIVQLKLDEKVAVNVSKLQRTNGELEIVLKDGKIMSYEKDLK